MAKQDPGLKKAKAKEFGIFFTGEKDTNHPHPLIFTSWRSDVDVINAGVDIIALTSFMKGTPVSLIEAQAANNPIVSTRVGGISDVVLEGKSGLLSHLYQRLAAEELIGAGK